uniref:Uncharacterized protein n=1 Tax=Amphimedon queenslandica TaxID=400682 RepID=A0A1X7SPN1_AMPQE
MELSLLVAKAATPVGSLAGNTLAEGNEARWVISYHSFNCTTAAVTEFLFGVDVRSKYGNRNKYPSIEMWYYDGNSAYQKVLTLPIVLSPDNVTTNGLYRYVLPTPLSVSSSIYNRYRLGVYQPEDDSSVVRFYNATTSSTETVGRIRADFISESSIRITGSNREIDFQNTNNVFMLRLNTGMYHSTILIILCNYNTYRLGVYQPEDDSSTETVGRIRADSISESNIIIFGSDREIDLAQTTNVFMMHLMTSM